MQPWEYLLILGLVISVLIAYASSRNAAREKAARLKTNEEFQQKQAELTKMIAHAKGLSIIFEQRKIQFPWLASAIADLHALEAEQDAKLLQRKKHPAFKAAELVREHGGKRREAEKLSRLMRYKVEYYEKLFPWIVEFVGDDVPDDEVDQSGVTLEPTDDPVKKWLNDAEYQKLTTQEKNQLALDRWSKSATKTKWEIGRDYERYIGFVYETQGYDVAFTGAIEGLQDMGRDLIARRGNELLVIQCKRWSQEKTIHEKHIFQLFGSALEYAFRLGSFDKLEQLSLFGGPIKTTGVKAVLYTSTKISDVAKKVAEKLQVVCHENVQISVYPLIKCNIAPRDGQKIYHLPFDQQYDRTKIISGTGEKYVYTVAEAEKAGFRRAWKWRPDRGT